MTPPSQFDGLADRRRVFPREAGAQYIQKLEVGELHIGGIVLQAIGGTRYANGRLSFAGKKDNSCEIQQEPGPECQGKGVVVQWLMFTIHNAKGWLRHCFSWNRDETGGDIFNEDQGASGTRVCGPWNRNMGARTFEQPGKSARTGKQYRPGEDDGGRDIDTYFRDGSDEITMADGRRIERRSMIALLERLEKLHPELAGTLQIRGPAGQ